MTPSKIGYSNHFLALKDFNMEELGFLVHLLCFAYNFSFKNFAIFLIENWYLHCTSLTFLCFYLSSLITLFTFALTAKLSRRLDGNNYNKHHGTSDLDLQCISININRYPPNSVDPQLILHVGRSILTCKKDYILHQKVSTVGLILSSYP